MKPFSIISANPKFTKATPDTEDFLNISEFFCDTIQGEGINTGCPAMFLRLQDCTLNCLWCDTRSVWRYGNPYTFDEIFEMMARYNIFAKLKNGQHLVITGGSPLLQQNTLIRFLKDLVSLCQFYPYIEVENECTIMPKPEFEYFVNTWNNSPKLANSGNAGAARFKPDILSHFTQMNHIAESDEQIKKAWFKFVVTNDKDWDEITRDFLSPNYIRSEDIILMPEGATRDELMSNYEKVVEIAVREGVRCCSREHIILWDKATGV